MVFNQIERISLCAAIVGLVGIFLVALVGGIRNLPKGSRRRLGLPGVMLALGPALAVADVLVSPSLWDPQVGFVGFSDELRAILHGHTWAWASLAHTLCSVLAITFLLVGGALLLSRAKLGINACRWLGRLAAGAAASLGVALACTLAWSSTLSTQAPGYLSWGHLGLFGTSLLSVFVVAVVVMAGATGLVIAGCRRCLWASAVAL